MTASRPERTETLPGDEIVSEPMIVTDRAITIGAPPEHVWPWIVQMGWHRGAWYTARWVDRLLFPANGPSAEHILPEWQDLAEGDWVPDGAPGCTCEHASGSDRAGSRRSTGCCSRRPTS
jgi:hypothetical protein